MLVFVFFLFFSSLHCISTLFSPLSLRQTNVTTTSITVSWRTIDPNAVAFIASISPLNEREAIESTQYTNRTTATWQDLIPGKNYSIAVTARDKFNNNSLPVSTTVTTIPLPPYRVRVSKFVNPVLSEYEIDRNQTMMFPVYGAVIMWDGPDSGYFDGFDVQISPSNGIVRLPITLREGMPIAEETRKRRIVWDLVPGVYYEFTIRTRSRGQLSHPANSSSRMQPEIPGPITIVSIQTTSATLSWKSPHRGILDGFVVEVDPPEGEIFQPENPELKWRRIENLTAGTEYQIDVYSTSFEVLSFQPRKINITTPPNPPRGPAIASNFTNTSVVIRWNPPLGNFEYYEIIYYATSQNFGKIRHRVYVSAVRLTSLIPSIKYSLIVYAVSNTLYSNPLFTSVTTGVTDDKTTSIPATTATTSVASNILQPTLTASPNATIMLPVTEISSEVQIITSTTSTDEDLANLIQSGSTSVRSSTSPIMGERITSSQTVAILPQNTTKIDQTDVLSKTMLSSSNTISITSVIQKVTDAITKENNLLNLTKTTTEIIASDTGNFNASPTTTSTKTTELYTQYHQNRPFTSAYRHSVTQDSIKATTNSTAASNKQQEILASTNQSLRSSGIESTSAQNLYSKDAYSSMPYTFEDSTSNESLSNVSAYFQVSTSAYFQTFVPQTKEANRTLSYFEPTKNSSKTNLLSPESSPTPFSNFSNPNTFALDTTFQSILNQTFQQISPKTNINSTNQNDKDNVFSFSPTDPEQLLTNPETTVSTGNFGLDNRTNISTDQTLIIDRNIEDQTSQSLVISTSDSVGPTTTPSSGNVTEIYNATSSVSSTAFSANPTDVSAAHSATLSTAMLHIKLSYPPILTSDFTKSPSTSFGNYSLTQFTSNPTFLSKPPITATSSIHIPTERILADLTFPSINTLKQTTIKDLAGTTANYRDIEQTTTGSESVIAEGNGNAIQIKKGFTTICKPDNITVLVDKAVIGQYEDDYGPLHLNEIEDESCRGVEYENYYRYTIAPNILDCGTTIELNETHVNFTNSISNTRVRDKWLRSMTDNGGIVLFGHRFSPPSVKFVHLRLWCTFPLDINVTSMYPFLPQLTFQVLSFNISGHGEFSAVMKIYKNSSYLQPYIFSPTINSTDILYVGITLLDATDDTTNIVVQRCWGTPERSPNHTSSYPIISERCPIEDSLDGSVRVIGNGQGRTVRWEGNVFKFISSSEVWLHCEIKLCFGMDCVPNCDSKRRKRSLEHGTIDNLHILSTGPIVLRKEKQTASITTSTSDILTSQDPSSPIIPEIAILIIVVVLGAIIIISCLLVFCIFVYLQRNSTRRSKPNKAAVSEYQRGAENLSFAATDIESPLRGRVQNSTTTFGSREPQNDITLSEIASATLPFSSRQSIDLREGNAESFCENTNCIDDGSADRVRVYTNTMTDSLRSFSNSSSTGELNTVDVRQISISATV